jgi:hypothetical protein
MRNNSERIRKMDTNPQTQDNPLLNFVKPTSFVELPSKGKGYIDNHPLKGNEVIEIYQMTAKDEDILTSQSLLKKGIAIDRFIENIIVDKNISVDSLLVCDKNAILLESRMLGYGPDYEIDITCPNCLKESKENYDLGDKQINFGKQELISGDGFIDYKLPRSEVDVKIKLLTSREESEIIQSMLGDKKETSVSQQLNLMIVSANGIEDRGQISQFIEAMPIIDSLSLRKHYKEVTPNVDMKFNFECKSCNHEQELEVPLGVGFFWPNL